MKTERKVFTSEVLKCDDAKLIIEHWISTEKQDDGGDIMRADGMQVRGRPVVCLNHPGYGGTEPTAKPLGIRVGVNDKGHKGLIATTQFYDGSKLDPPDNTGRRLYEKAKGGFMPNWSIDYQAIKFTALAAGGRDVIEWNLLGYSQVPHGMNDEATTPEYKALAGQGLKYELDEVVTVAVLETQIKEIKVMLEKLLEKQQTAPAPEVGKKSVFDLLLDGDATASEKPAGTEDMLEGVFAEQEEPGQTNNQLSEVM